MGDLRATTSGLVTEVRSLAEAVQANTAAMQVEGRSLAAAVQAEGRQTRCHLRNTNTRQLQMQAVTNSYLHRIALVLEGSLAARERPLDVPLPDNPPPPEAPPRRLRTRSLGTRRSPRQGR